MKKNRTGTCVTESLCCTPETNKTLWINCTRIQNKNLNMWKTIEGNGGKEFPGRQSERE